jgi:predicted enzyme related to lactoylglutathione lyase
LVQRSILSIATKRDIGKDLYFLYHPIKTPPDVEGFVHTGILEIQQCLIAIEFDSISILSPSQEPRVKIKSTNTILYCTNWEQTVEFYRTGLKLPVLSSTEWFVEFKLNAMSRISVADEARTSIRSSSGNGITVSLQVDDIEQTRTELMEAGIATTPIKEVWGSKVIYIHDPEGNRLEFWSGRAKA